VLERTIKTAVKKRLTEIGAYQFWFVPFGMGDTTVDCVGCYKGRFFGIETKAPGKLPTLRQKITLEKIKAAGGLVFVIDNVEAANELFRDDNFAGD
jgi:penicillin-binding protein-related factor A (putative recombinase)